MDTHSSGNFGENPGYGSEQRFPWGCLLGGCLTVIALMVVGVLVTGFATFQFYKGQLTKYTSDTPKDLPVVELPAEEVAAIEQKIEAFKEQVEEGADSDELVLTAEDINALIAKEEKLRGKVFVRIEDSKIGADVSIPTDGIPGGKGRYFNGSVRVNVELEDGVLMVTIDEAEVNGLPVPEVIMEGLRQENLAKEMYKDVDAAKRLARIEKIEIGNDRIVLKVRKEKQSDAEQATEADATDATDKAAGEGTEIGETSAVAGEAMDADVRPAEDAVGEAVNAEVIDESAFKEINPEPPGSLEPAEQP